MATIETIEDFQNHVNTLEQRTGYVRPKAFALGIRRSKRGKTLDVLYPYINHETNYGSAAILSEVSGLSGTGNGFAVLSQDQLTAAYHCFKPFYDADMASHRNVGILQQLLKHYQKSSGYADVDVIVYFLCDANLPVSTAEEAYFKLQCLSQRCVKPHGLSVAGLFGVLQNVAWTNYGPILPEDLDEFRLETLWTERPLQVSHVDKFPYLVDYHVPSGCRIAANSQVRLGAYLGEGTTVMPAGYINFNAGTAGHAMVEGRISAGVFVGKHSDIGGGASIMGTLSGGNNLVISVGEKCLLGANAGTGISLGFGCTIQAGLYITAGMRIYLYNQNNQPVNLVGDVVQEGENLVKALELSGRNHMLFIQDSRDGRVICKPNPKTIELNAALHSN